MSVNFQVGQSVVYDNEKYIFVENNPDGSYQIRRTKTSEIISVPPGTLHSFLREGKSEIGDKLKLNG